MTTRSTARLAPAGAALLAVFWAASAAAAGFETETFSLALGGYARGWASMNLQDPAETPQDERYELSMVRGSLLLDADARYRAVKLKAIGRFDREVRTPYLERLDDLAPGDLMDQYNQEELRELYVDFPIGGRLDARLGKQQVVWGETDFFRAADIVHGFDFRWRSFLEVENEELRKPLILANVRLQVPEAGGALQVIVRPGLDRSRDIGNTYDLFGGRWANQPNKGVNFLNLLTYDLEHPEGDEDDVTGGVRWSGTALGVGYSLFYLKTFSNDPVVNPSAAVGGTPFRKAPEGAVGDFIFPEIDLAGVTANRYVAFLDAVLSTEIVYTFDQPFNTGTAFLGGALPGFEGVILKDTLVTMLRADKQLDLTGILGTSRPSFASVQFFNTRVMDFDRQDDIVFLAGYGLPRHRDSALLTGILAANYRNDRINPGLAAGWDVTYGGGFVIPSVELVFGDHWRLKTEADLFFPKCSKSPGEIESCTGLFGYFDNNSQLVVRLTRQF